MARKEVFGVTVEGDISGLKSAMNEATRLFNSTERSIKNIDKALKLDPSNLDLLKQKQILVNQAIIDGEKALRDLQERQKDITSDPKFIAGYTDLTERYSELQLKIQQVTTELDKLREQASSMPTAEMQKFINTFDELGSKMTDIGNKTRLMSRAFQTMLVGSFESAVAYEEQIAGIQKVVSDLSDNTIAELKSIAVETGTAFEEVAEYATFTGALGVAEKDISKFTRTMIDLNTATGGAFAGEEGAKGLVVFLNNLGISVDKAENFGSAISVIGDAMADVGDETLQMAINMAGLSTIANVNQYDLIGLAGVMKNLGLRTSTSSSAMTRSFMAIEQAIANGGDKLNIFATTANMTAEEFANSWNNNATDTFLKFVDGIKSSVFDDINNAIKNGGGILDSYAETLGVSKKRFIEMWGEDSEKTLEKYISKMEELDDTSENASIILKELGLSGVRTAETLLKLSGQGDNVRDAIEMANKAWIENTALQRKSNIMYETTSKKLEGVKEAFKQAGSSLMDSTLPHINKTLDSVIDLAQGFHNLSPEARQLVLIFSSIAAAYSPVNRAMGKASSAFASLVTNLHNISFLGNVVTGTVVGLGVAMGSLAYAIGSNDSMYQYMHGLNEMNDTFKDLNVQADENYKKQSALIDISGGYAEKLDELNEILKEQVNNELDSADTKEKITRYISTLNDALGAEYFAFDDVNNKISYQGEVIDSVSDKLQSLATELKREAWLESHKDALIEAYDMQETARNGLVEAAEYYQKQIEKIPETYVDLYKSYNGDVQAIMDDIANGEFNGATEQYLGQLMTIYSSYKTNMDTIKNDLSEADKFIENYQAVSLARTEDVDVVLESMSNSFEKMLENFNTSEEKLEFLKNVREEYVDLYSEEELANDETLKQIDEQILKLQDVVADNNEIKRIIQEQNTERKDGMDTFDSWASEEAYKQLTIGVRYVYQNSGPQGFNQLDVPSIFGGSRSGGFGELRNSINNSLANNSRLNSGGFMSGGVTLNANFTINNGNNIDKTTVQGWASSMIDMINEELGGRI